MSGILTRLTATDGWRARHRELGSTATVAILALCWMAASAFLSAQQAADVLDAADRAMGTVGISSLHYEGHDGSVYLVGAALTSGGPWRDFTIQRLVVDAHYDQPAMRQAWELAPSKHPANDGVQVFGGATQQWFVYGNDAWDVRGNPARAELPLWEPFTQSRMGDWRNVEIWLTPPGFVRAARNNHATARREGAGWIVSFTTAAGRSFTGHFDKDNLVQRIETALPNAVMGDLSFEVSFGAYQPFGGVRFPERITEVVGGYPFLEFTVTSADATSVQPVGPRPAIPAALCVGCARGDITFKSDKLGDGAWYLDAGDNFASVLIEFKDYLVVCEAPQDDDRAGLVIAEAHRLAPHKQIRYLVASHWHFDHLGGARRFAADGAAILAAQEAVAGIEKYLNTPHTLVPDAFSRSGRKRVKIEGVKGKRVLTDGSRTLELYVLHLEHADPTLFAYLPKEKVLVTADVAVAPRPGAAPPRAPVPDSVQLYKQLVGKHIDVEQFAGVHWGRSTWKDLLVMVDGR